MKVDHIYDIHVSLLGCFHIPLSSVIYVLYTVHLSSLLYRTLWFLLNDKVYKAVLDQNVY